MINEIFLVNNNYTFWGNLFPNGKDYITLINRGLGERVNPKIEDDDVAQRRGLINSIAFSLFELAVTKKESIKWIKSFNFKSKEGKSLVSDAIVEVSSLSFGAKLRSSLTVLEVQLVIKLSDRLFSRYSTYSNLIIRPNIIGCGILESCEGDILYLDTLTEIKAGDRNYKISDIRQLYSYLALNYASSQYSINNLELYNPRTGVLFKESVDNVSMRLSGAPTVEVFTEILNFISFNDHSI